MIARKRSSTCPSHASWPIFRCYSECHRKLHSSRFLRSVLNSCSSVCRTVDSTINFVTLSHHQMRADLSRDETWRTARYIEWPAYKNSASFQFDSRRPPLSSEGFWDHAPTRHRKPCHSSFQRIWIREGRLIRFSDSSASSYSDSWLFVRLTRMSVTVENRNLARALIIFANNESHYLGCMASSGIAMTSMLCYRGGASSKSILYREGQSLFRRLFLFLSCWCRGL